MMVGSSLLGVVFTVAGLWISYAFDLDLGRIHHHGQASFSF
jgi:zinc transport system permease protein